MINRPLLAAFTAILALLVTATALHAQVPQLVNYQGRVAVGAVNFNGSGHFKFALVNTDGTATYWSNDGLSSAGSEPAATVALTVTNGLYSVFLGDTTLANMTAIPASVWTNADVRLRVWFDDNTHGSQRLTPDQRLAPNGYLPDGSVSAAKIASGAVGSTQLAANAVQSGNIAAGAVDTSKISGLGSGVATFLATPSSANLGAVITGATLADGTRITVTGTWPNQTINVSGLLATDSSYTRSGSGMSTRTVGAELDETALTTKGAGGAVDGTTDDTAALQRQLDSKGHVRLSQGMIKITDNVSMSTIGQIVEGAGVGEATGTYGTTIYQTTAGKNGLQFLTSADSQISDGGGLFDWQLRSLRLYTANWGTGTGFVLGTDGGQYGAASCTLSDIKAIGFLTGVDFGYAGMSRAWNISLDGPGAGVAGSVGLKIHGAQANSQIWVGLAAGNWETAVSIDTTTQGLVMLPGDIGASGTSFRETSQGANGVIIGGNWENYTSRMFNLVGDSNNVIIEPGYNLDGSQTNEPYLLNGNKLIFIGHTGGFHNDGSVMQFKGEGHVVLNPNVGINTTGSGIASGGVPRQWTQGVFPATSDNGLPPPSASNFGAIMMVIPRTAALGPADIRFVNQKTDGTYFWDSLCTSTVTAGNPSTAGSWTFNGTVTENAYQSATAGSSFSINTSSDVPAVQVQQKGAGAYVAQFQNSSNIDVMYVAPWGAGLDSSAFLYAPRSEGCLQTNDWWLYSPASNHFGIRNGGANVAGSTQMIDVSTAKTSITSGVLNLRPIARPVSPTEGDIYVDSGDHHTYEYNGTAWVQLDH